MRIRVRNNRPTGRPLAWSDEQLIAAGLEWQRRYGQLPRASDWSTAKARSKGGDHRRRLQATPTGAPRWPPASTINDAFGSWTRFRESCLHPHHHQPPAPSVAATLLRTAEHHEIVVHGASGIVEQLYEQWRATAPPSSAPPELEFVLWALTRAHVALREPDDPLGHAHATDLERVAWQLLTTRDRTRLLFTAAPIADQRPVEGQLTLFDDATGKPARRERGSPPKRSRLPRPA